MFVNYQLSFLSHSQAHLDSMSGRGLQAPGETDGGTVLLSDGLNGCERCGINGHGFIFLSKMLIF